MTKLLEETIERLKQLPDEQQDEMASLVLMRLDDDGEIPQWHKHILDERLADLEANPDAGVPLETVAEELRLRWKK